MIFIDKVIDLSKNLQSHTLVFERPVYSKLSHSVCVCVLSHDVSKSLGH
jgi:hypothetical protein